MRINLVYSYRSMCISRQGNHKLTISVYDQQVKKNTVPLVQMQSAKHWNTGQMNKTQN